MITVGIGWLVISLLACFVLGYYLGTRSMSKLALTAYTAGVIDTTEVVARKYGHLLKDGLKIDLNRTINLVKGE